MKLFLKPTAFFATIALLFCACSDDDTATTRATTPADPSEVTSITAGNGKFEVKWVVPEGDDNVKYCVISWSGTSGSGDYTMYADNSDEMTYTKDGLLAGSYTVSVKNYGDIELDSPEVTATVDVYDYTMYSDVPTVASMFISGDDVTIEWGEVPADCIGVSIAYTNKYGEADSKSLTSIDLPFVVSEVMSGTEFTYTPYYQPEGGLDAVMLINESTAKGTFPTLRYGSVPATPTGIKIYPGDYQMCARWDIVDEPYKVVVTYDDGTDTRYFFTDFTQAADSVFVANVPVGTYNVSLRTISEDGNASETVSVEDIYVYDWIQYRLMCTPPEIDESVYFGDDYQLRLNWVDNDECKDLKLVYMSDYDSNSVTWQSDSEAPLSDLLILDDCIPGGSYIATAVYIPTENCMDTLTRTTSGTFPSAPVWKSPQDRNDEFSSYVYIWKEYEMKGDASIESSDGLAWSFDRMFDSTYDDATQYSTASNATASMQTVTIDLGRTYKLSKFGYTPYYSSSVSGSPYAGSNVKILNVYATNVKDPEAYTTTYNNYSSVASINGLGVTSSYVIPDLTYWECLLSNATVDTDSAVNNSTYYTFEFDIADSFEPMRYIRIQFVQSFENDATNDFFVGELDFWHNGVWDIDNGWDGEYKAYTEW